MSKTENKMFVKIESLRALLPQIIACCIKNTINFHLGMTINFSTIIIPALRGITSNDDFVETLSFTNEQASWFGSVMFICQLIGAIISGWIIDAFGRKQMLLLSSVPCAIGFVMFYYSNSVEIIFAAYILMALVNGVAQVTCATYTSEICDKDIRAVMFCIGTVTVTAGSLALFTIATITNWRVASLICLVFPISAFILTLFIPETPVWLLSKNREKEARESLQWLRGWVTPDAVEDELKTMKENLKESQNSEKERGGVREKLRNFFEMSNLVPFFIVIMLFSISQSNGVVSITPFLVQVLKTFGVAIDVNWSTVAVATVALIGTIGCASSIRYLGKRKVCLTGLVACLISTSGLALYSTVELPPHWNSFDLPENADIKVSWIPLVCIMGLFLFTNFSIVEVPWMYASELFSFKNRCFSSGMAVSFSLLVGFLNTKTYIDLEVGLSIDGTMWFFAAVTAIFIPFIYFFVPETESISMEDIQTFFSHKNHKITCINIPEFLESQKQEQNQIQQPDIVTVTVL